MTRRCLILSAAVIALASAASVAQKATIYEGQSLSASGPLVVAGWGSGSAREVSEEGYVGARSLRVVTHGYYAGVRFDLQRPIDLRDFLGKPNSYVVLTVKPALPVPGQTTTRTSTTSRTTSGTQAETPDTAYTFPYPPGEEPPEANLPVGVETRFRMERMRVVLDTDGGVAVAEDLDVRKAIDEERGWKQVVVPLSFFKGSVNGMLRRAIVSGNTTDMFYLGEMKIVTEPVAKIALDTAVEPYEAKVGEKITFTAQAQAGIAPLEIVWDFDASDGFQEEAVGETVYNYYYKAGEYTATCIVKDLSGAQEPLKRTLGIRVVAQ